MGFYQCEYGSRQISPVKLKNLFDAAVAKRVKIRPGKTGAAKRKALEQYAVQVVPDRCALPGCLMGPVSRMRPLGSRTAEHRRMSIFTQALPLYWSMNA